MPKLLKIFFTITAVMIQISFLPVFNSLVHFNVILVLLIVLLFFQPKTNQLAPIKNKIISGDLSSLIYFVAAAGIILDLYSILPFPVITLSLIIAVLLLNALLKNLFTNHSFYSLLLLGIIGTVIYNFILNILIYLNCILGLADFSIVLNKPYFSSLGWQIILNLLFLSLTWLFINFFKLKLQKTFFFKK